MGLRNYKGNNIKIFFIAYNLEVIRSLNRDIFIPLLHNIIN